MSFAQRSRRILQTLACACLLIALAGSSVALAQDKPQGKDDASPPTTTAPTGRDPNAPQGTVKLKIVVTNPRGNPVANASVYVRYYGPGEGLLHRDTLQELDLKTNQDGSVKAPPVPQGKIQVQVIATGWHTFGEWFDVEKQEQSINIQLQEPPHWY